MLKHYLVIFLLVVVALMGCEYNEENNLIDAVTYISGETTYVNSEIGMFDPCFDYTAMPRYRVAYITNYPNTAFEALSDSFQKWADETNCEYYGKIEYLYDVDALVEDLPILAE